MSGLDYAHDERYASPAGAYFSDGPANVDTITWLDERRIMPTSQPLFYVEILGTPPEENRGQFPYHYILRREFIQNASIEGKAPGARKGNFSFVDPEGVWASVLANAGAYSNSIEGKGKPNLIIHFGWQGLRGETSSAEEMQKITGLILKTKFSIDPDTAMTTIEVHFIEAVMAWLNNLRFLDPYDMIILDQLEHDNIKEMNVGELLTYIWEESSIQTQIRNSGADVQIYFAQTGSDKGTVDGRKFKIRYGDGFIDKINEISAQAEYTVEGEDDDPDIVWSYERRYKDDWVDEDDNYHARLIYGWKKASLGQEEDSPNVGDVWEGEVGQGPNLLWKSQRLDGGSKQMITWDSDLNSKEYLTLQAQDELTKKLAQYTDSDWDAMQEYLSKLANETDGGNQISSTDALQNAQEDLTNISERGALGRGWARLFNNAEWQIANDENRRQLVETLIQGERTPRTSGDGASQIAAIIANNVFKGTATILGDPYFGTELLPYQVEMTMMFEDVGDFASLFQREWLLTNVVHKFSESGYFTEIEVLSYPKQNINITQEDLEESWSESLSSARRDADGNITGL